MDAQLLHLYRPPSDYSLCSCKAGEMSLALWMWKSYFMSSIPEMFVHSVLSLVLELKDILSANSLKSIRAMEQHVFILPPMATGKGWG